MPIYAIGDIHGCYRALTTLEGGVPLGADDRIVTLGDYIDRGPDSYAVLEWLIERKAGGNLVPLRGNHELMMCAARHSQRHYDEWVACGGDRALASYRRSLGISKLPEVPERHWRFMKSDCPPYYETATHFFVHANAYPDVPLSEQPDYMLYWEHFNDSPPHESGKIMVCGHTPQRSGVPLCTPHAVCLDTNVQAGGWLTCLDVQSGRYWQANENRQLRSGFLDVPLQSWED